MSWGNILHPAAADSAVKGKTDEKVRVYGIEGGHCRVPHPLTRLPGDYLKY